MRYWRPADDLAGLVSGYHLYAVVPGANGERRRDVLQPAWPILRLTFGDPLDWRVRPPGHPWSDVPPIALFGPTSGVTWSEAGAGVTVGIGILPRGWVRLARASAAQWANRVAAPGSALRGDLAALAQAVSAADTDEAVPALFDAFLREALEGNSSEDPRVAAIEKALLDHRIETVAALAAVAGISVRALERLARSAFGFPPKLLLRRARFLRSLHAVAEAPPGEGAAALDPSYTDYSHFVRDAQAFLGMSPRAFLKLDNPMLKQSLALRRAVLGAPAQALARAGDA